MWPWVLCCEKFYNASVFLDLPSHTHFDAWRQRVVGRPGTQRGIRVNGFGPGAIAERHCRADFDDKTEVVQEGGE